MALFKCLQDNSWDGLQGYRRNIIYSFTSNPNATFFEEYSASDADADVIVTTPMTAHKDREGDWHVDANIQTRNISAEAVDVDSIDAPLIDNVLSIDFNIVDNASFSEGTIAWSNTEDTLAIGMPGGNVNQQVGMEVFLPRRVENKTGSNLKNGDLIYISGGSGNNVYVALAKADAFATARTTIAMLTEDIDNNAKGFATTFGLVRGTAAQPIDTSSYSVGSMLYLSGSTAGAFTDTMPQHPAYVCSIGHVFRSHATEGAIIVKIMPPMAAKCIAGGDASVWDDMQANLSNFKLPASSYPTERFWNMGIGGGVTFPVFGFAVNNYVYFDVQTSHSMLLESVLDFHIHYSTPTDGTGSRFKFQLDVVAAGVDGTWAVPTGSPFTAEKTMDADDSASHRVFEIADIPEVNTTVSTVYKCKFTRIAATQDEYAGEVYISYGDCHFQRDSLGSRNEYTKG